jgi:hypothetical protein
VTPHEAMLEQVERQLKQATVGGIAATELLRLKARLLGLTERTEPAAEVPPKTAESDSDWVRISDGEGFYSRRNCIETYGSLGPLGTEKITEPKSDTKSNGETDANG